MCVCVCERERETDRQTERESYSQYSRPTLFIIYVYLFSSCSSNIAAGGKLWQALPVVVDPWVLVRACV